MRLHFQEQVLTVKNIDLTANLYPEHKELDKRHQANRRQTLSRAF